jgi:hypothetical protein
MKTAAVAAVVVAAGFAGYKLYKNFAGGCGDEAVVDDENVINDTIDEVDETPEVDTAEA